MLFKGGVLSSMGWQHHPPRHAAARAALGVQAAHATLGMAPPHMPPSSPRHANAKRARPRHRGQPSHATAVTPCPVHAAPRTRPMPPMRTRPPPHATSALPAHSAPSLPVSARPLERACCLGKTCQWPTSRLTPGGSPMPPARRCPSKGTRTPLPPCNECPPRALGPVSARRGALEPSSEHVASEKLANGQRRGSPRGAHPCLPPDAAHQKAHGRPSPHATSALPVHSAPSRLAEEPSSPRASMLPRKSLPMASVAAHPRGAHPCLPPDAAHRKAHGCPSPPCNESPSRVLGPSSRLVEEPSSPRASMLPRKNVLVANVAAHPGGSPMPPARRCPSKGTRMPLPPMQRVPYPGARPPRLGSSRSPQALERACCLGKNVPVANVAAHPGGSPMPPARRCPSKGTRMPLPPMQRVPSPGTRPRPGSSRSLQALERACCLRKEPDASSPCLYRSYEGFTRCSRVLVRSRLRTSRGSTRDAVS